MTKAQARKYVYRILSTEVRHHISNGSDWTFIGDGGMELSSADTDRIYAVLEEIAESFERRGRTGEEKPAPCSCLSGCKSAWCDKI